MPKHVIQVAPLIPLPVLRTQVFSYWHGEALPVGTLVSAPFYFREIRGVVLGSHQNFSRSSRIKLKKIKSVIEKNFLSADQIELARKIANYYFSPLGSVLKIMVPSPVKKKKSKQEIARKKRLAGKIGPEAGKIIKSQANKFLIFGSPARREKIGADLMRECVKAGKQCLILVPEIFFSHSVYEKIRETFSEEVALIHGRVSKGQYWDCWKKIKSGGIKIVIASRLGIFLPFSSLGLIIAEDEQDPSFKQSEKMPRYSAVRGAEFLAGITGAKLVLESSAPSTEILWRADQKDFSIIKPSAKKEDFPKVEIVRLEAKGNPNFPISQSLIDHLKETLSQKKQAVLFMNRRGLSTRSICAGCNKVLKCQDCNRALVFSEELGKYSCLQCSKKMDMFTICPSCGSFQFSHRGLGTQTVEKKMKQLFPGAEISRIDSDTMKSKAKYGDILKKYSQGKIDILIGTQLALKGVPAGNVGLVGMVSALDLSDKIDFRSRETAHWRLFQAAGLLDGKGTLVIQSFFSGNPLFEFLEKRDFRRFYNREIAMRKKFSYPPFGGLVKLTFRNKSKNIAAEETQKIFDLMVATGNNEIEAVGPYEPISPQKRGYYLQNILIKMKTEKSIRDLPARSVIGALKKGWSVDVDPVSLL